MTETRSPRQVSYWFVLPPESLTVEQSDQFQQILRAQPQLAQLHTLVGTFRTLLFTHVFDSTNSLQSCIDTASHGTQPELKGFAQGLLRDSQALQAAITTTHSSGQVEGQINRLKLIKRMIYGRGKLDLLRKRVMFSLA